MYMYGKIFESIFDSTLVVEGGWLPTYIFISMIVLADKDGYVEIAPKALYRRLGFSDDDKEISYEDFTAALSFLQDVDASSKSPEADGRRIYPLADLPDCGDRGFKIVNYMYYRDLGRRTDRAQNSTERVRKWREKQKKNNNETQGSALKRGNPHTDTDTDRDTDSRKRRAAPPQNGGGAGAFHGRSCKSDEIERCRKIARTHKLALRKSDDEVFKIVQEIRSETTMEELQKWLQSSELMSGGKE